MAALGFELLTRLFLGFFLAMLFVSRVETSEKFVKIAFRIGSGIVVVALWLSYASEKTISMPEDAALMAAWVGFLFYVFFLPGLWRALGALLLLGSIGFFAQRAGFLSGLEFLGSVLLLGSIYMGQFLGHWYLNVPGMHIRELSRVVKILAVALVLRTFTNLWTLLVERIFQQATTDSMLLYGIRSLWGLIPLYVLAYMIYRTTKIRSTQSATGIYYAASVMVLVGEAVAIYLKNTLGWNV